MSSLTRQQLEAWIKTLKVSGRVLDAGGSQKSAMGRIGAEEGTEFVTLDLAEPHEDSPTPDLVCDLNEVHRSHPTDDNFTDCDEPEYRSETVMSHKGHFDYVLCFEVAEYWWNPYQALKNLNWFLKDGGVLYMSVPFVYPVHNPKHNDYLRYTDMGISFLLENAGFRVDELIPRTAGNYQILQAFYDADGMKASKQYGSHESVGWLIKATKI